MSDPRITFVVAARNDDHGGGFLKRFRLFGVSLLTQARKYDLDGELIIVDWNTPEGSAPLRAVAELGEAPPRFRVRFVEVPPAVHQTFAHSEDIPFYQMIAKNVGIRRAEGKFVLATNCDILFSEEMIEFLAKGKLQEGVMYRTDRLDVPSDAPEGSLDERLAWCAGHVIRRHGRLGSTVFDPRYRMENIDGLGRISRAVKKAGKWTLGLMRDSFRVHNNACGDFTLLARESWNALSGYAELPIWSMHIDSLLCFAAVAGGIKQVILRDPLRIYHTEHGLGWSALSAREKYDIFARRPWLDLALLNEARNEMFRTRKPIVLNGPDWGLPHLESAPPGPPIARTPSITKARPMPFPLPETCRMSFVVAARNDDHGGHFLKRFRLFGTSLLHLARKHRLEGELIVVDWNSPESSHPFRQVADLGDGSPHFSVRFVEVPSDAHRTLAHSEHIPFYQMIAKNVGIRRARGKYVVATNCDILFSEELIEYLAKGELGEGSIYRIDRLDVPAEAPEGPVEERLAWCRAHVVRRHGRRGSKVFDPAYAMATSSGLDHLRELLTLSGKRTMKFLRGYLKVHGNAAGDFTLMSRSLWHALRGYPELQVWPAHLDALTCFAAMSGGAKQIVLEEPLRIYHLEHAKKWMALTPLERFRLFSRSPWVPLDLYEDLCNDMFHAGKPMTFNAPDWGFGELNLAEYASAVQVPTGIREGAN